MKILKKWLVLVVLVMGSPSFGGVPPSGWTYMSAPSKYNVAFYKKNGSEVYVQVINLLFGAKVEMQQIYVKDVRSPYNGKLYPGYKRDTVATWYARANNPVSVINGDYFSDSIDQNIGILAFPVRSNWTLLNAGADPINDRQLELISYMGVRVVAANISRLYNQPNNIIQNAIGGYSPSNATSFTEERGRTGMCAYNTNPSPYLLIFSYRKATQSVVNSDLSAWGCAPGSEIMMDGSASAQLRTSITNIKIDGVAKDDAIGRSVPQVIII